MTTPKATELWLATGNAKKLGELQRLLAPLGYRIRALAELDNPPTIVEDGDTFADNAAIKAVTLARAVGGLALGDDSGLCVTALDGRPGVRSARFAGIDASDTDNVNKLLEELREVESDSRQAAFVCHLCLADPGGEVLATFDGRCEGRIPSAPSGSDGFGYDPVFVCTEVDADSDRSFAEFTAAEKDAVSHRGRALRQLASYLRESETLSSDPNRP